MLIRVRLGQLATVPLSAAGSGSRLRSYKPHHVKNASAVNDRPIVYGRFQADRWICLRDADAGSIPRGGCMLLERGLTF